MTVLQPGDRPKTGAPPPEEIAMTPHKSIPSGIAIAINVFEGRSSPIGQTGTTMDPAVRI